VVEIRFITAEDVAEYRRAIHLGFGGDPASDDPAEVQLFADAHPLETSMVAVDRARFVATFGSFDFDLTVPGGTVPMAGTTVVTVQPTHRRQGLLTRMMRTHLDQAIERGQPLAGLWASEERIYGRFGYGRACTGVETTIPTNLVTLPPGPDGITVRSVDADEARRLLPPVYGRARPATPGWLSRSEAWWELRHLSDFPHQREGASARRFVVAERGDETAGYVSYRQRRRWAEIPDGTIEVAELVAVDDDARRSLWHFASNIDLFPNLRWWNVPVDDPVFAEADRFRCIKAQPADTLWLRLLDVHEALEGRRYERDGRLVLAVGDRFLSRGGTFSLEVTGGVASCKPSTTSPDVELDMAALSAIYLGGVSAAYLARAGRLSGPADAIRTMDDVFRTTRPPHCIEVF
jgi:predicted acetyltransferase